MVQAEIAANLLTECDQGLAASVALRSRMLDIGTNLFEDIISINLEMNIMFFIDTKQEVIRIFRIFLAFYAMGI